MNAEKMLCKIKTLNRAKEEASKIFWERLKFKFKSVWMPLKIGAKYNYSGERSGLIPL